MLLSWLFVRIAIASCLLLLLFLSQRFWYRSLWRWSGRWGKKPVRVGLRLLYLVGLLLIIASLADSLRNGHGNVIPRGTFLNVVTGLWFFSALFAYLSVKCVHVIERVWRFLKARHQPAVDAEDDAPPLDPGRRYFFKTATAAAGAAPFLGAMYGFASERLNYQIHRVEIPVSNLPAALDGMKIAQLSDIHIGDFMPADQVRRAVDLANSLGADLAVVTGDFITSNGDPLQQCIAELSRLRAPLGVWGCNGNHEIYADAEDLAEELFNHYGMRLLRQNNAELNWKGEAFNLIGVDYQRQHAPLGLEVPMLQTIEPLVRRDIPNILLSHNPNSFRRAAELGIELSLAGHTHGGQVKVEIIDHSWSPARFITPFVAGLYQLPLHPHDAASNGTAKSALYVNRGLGTIGIPARLGVDPEISLLTLRRQS